MGLTGLSLGKEQAGPARLAEKGMTLTDSLGLYSRSMRSSMRTRVMAFLGAIDGRTALMLRQQRRHPPPYSFAVQRGSRFHGSSEVSRFPAQTLQ